MLKKIITKLKVKNSTFVRLEEFLFNQNICISRETKIYDKNGKIV